MYDSEMKQFCKRKNEAFTTIDLLFVIAVMAVFAGLSLKALTNGRAQAVQCMNNQRQLMVAALAYPDDFNGIWIPNEPSGTGGQIDWVNLNMDFSNTTDDTNISKLINPQYSLLAPYIGGNATIFHCPADKSYEPSQSGFRVRSVSANAAVGSVWAATGCLVANGPVNGQWLVGDNIGSGCQTLFCCYGKNTDFVFPGPASTWVFADEHPDSINDSSLAVQCGNQGIGSEFIDRPANYHNRGATFAFADGHVEIHQWIGPTLGSAPDEWTGPAAGGYSVVNSADSSDFIWLQQRTSARK